MAEGGRIPEEKDFGDDDLGPFQTASEAGSLLSSLGPRSLSQDEGYCRSPDTTPREVAMGQKELEKKLESVVGVLGGLTEATKSTKQELEVLQERLEACRLGQAVEVDAQAQHKELQELIRLVEEKSQEVDIQVKKEVERHVQEVMDQRKSEILAEVKHLIEAQREEERLAPSLTNQRAEEVSEAIKEASRERDSMKKRFEVTLAKLHQQQENNQCLLKKIHELEKRCRELEEENVRLRTDEILIQTQFVGRSDDLECFSCKEGYVTHRNPADGCMFHPLPSMPYESWRNYILQEELPTDFRSMRSYRFWVCCNTLANRRPEGCVRGRHHQRWEMDILMKQVLAKGEKYTFSHTLIIQK